MTDSLDAEKWLRAVRATSRVGVGPQEIPTGWTLLGGAVLNDRMFILMVPVDALVNLGPDTLQYVIRSCEMRCEQWLVGEASTLVSRGGKLWGGYVYHRRLTGDGRKFLGESLEGSRVERIVERSRSNQGPDRVVLIDRLPDELLAAAVPL